MRIPKYRAWDTHEKELFEVVMLEWSAATSGALRRMQLVSLSKPDIMRQVVGAAFKEYDLLACTGIKDSQGSEIYEGDIVRINHPQDRTGDFTNALGEVFWWDEEGAWYHGNNHGRPPKRMWEYVEVIGTIYENPELLS